MEQLPVKIDRYEIRSELGRGGMATVYRAYDPNFDREVALKILPPGYLHDPTFRERFTREARTVAKLEHNAIVPVYDTGEENNQLFLVMRYMPGESLADTIFHNGPYDAEAILPIIQRVCAALDYAHRHKVIHRDIKPGNVLFDQQGEAYLTDFGIAKLVDGTGSLTGRDIMGTPAYMAPEQASGDPIDGRSDIYSVGVLIYIMLTGTRPYEATTPMGLAVKHITAPIPDVRAARPDLPAGIGEVIQKAMAKDPDQRFQTGEELAEAYATALNA
ncbi:MAG: serine/threonine protein kinase, partial [Chloroflexi bacterium]|nr:serine/threonine protein kinase [Chloroflexota bacterium]